MPPREPKETQKEPQKNKNELKNKKNEEVPFHIVFTESSGHARLRFSEGCLASKHDFSRSHFSFVFYVTK